MFVCLLGCIQEKEYNISCGSRVEEKGSETCFCAPCEESKKNFSSSPEPCAKLRERNDNSSSLSGTSIEQTNQPSCDSVSIISGVVGAAIWLALETIAVLVYVLIR